ncbi:MAG: O-antigen ligase family protein, partial [Candidatus Omnitrophota bacterium]
MDVLIIYDRLIESLLVFLLAFTPLAFGAVHPWSIAIFEVAAALIAFFWILKMLSRNKSEFIFSPFLALFLILISYSSLQFFLSYNTHDAIRNTQYTIHTIYSWATKTELLKLISYLLIFLVTLNTIRTKVQLKRVMAVIITVGFFMSIFYLMRYFGAPAPCGFVNSDHFSAYLGMIIPLSLGLLLIENTSVRPLLFFTIIVMGGALFFTMSRGGMFSFIAALLFIALLASTRRSMKDKGWLILAIAVFIILIIAWLGATPVVERILSFKAEITSRYFGGRLPIWEGTLNIIKDNPIFGTGLGTFNYTFPKYQPLAIINKHYTYAHSDFLELLSETGIIGFSLFVICGLWSMVYLFRRFNQRHDPWVTGLSICVFGSLGSIFIHSFTDFNLHIPANAILLSVILALFVSILNTTNEAISCNTPIIRFQFVALAVGLLIVYAVAAVRPALNLDPTNAEYYYELGKQQGKLKAYNSQLIAYSKAVALNPTNSQYHQSLAWAYGQLYAFSRPSSVVHRPS